MQITLRVCTLVLFIFNSNYLFSRKFSYMCMYIRCNERARGVTRSRVTGRVLTFLGKSSTVVECQ